MVTVTDWKVLVAIKKAMGEIYPHREDDYAKTVWSQGMAQLKLAKAGFRAEEKQTLSFVKLVEAKVRRHANDAIMAERRRSTIYFKVGGDVGAHFDEKKSDYRWRASSIDRIYHFTVSWFWLRTVKPIWDQLIILYPDFICLKAEEMTVNAKDIQLFKCTGYHWTEKGMKTGYFAKSLKIKRSAFGWSPSAVVNEINEAVLDHIGKQLLGDTTNG